MKRCRNMPCSRQRLRWPVPRHLPGLLFAVGLWLLVGWPAVAATDQDGDDAPDVLVLGRISEDPKTHYDELKPLLDYVVPRMADVGIRKGRILMARDMQQMTSYLRRGRVDWVSETSGGAMLLADRARAQILALTERDGVARYRTVFLGRRDGQINSLADLRGRSVAFQNPTSTSAYFLPASEMMNSGLPLELLLSPSDRPSSRTVGYVFARTELNIATWVHKKLVDAGTMSDIDWNNPYRVPALYRNDLKVIHRTAEVPRAVEMVRGDLPPRIRARLRQVLLDAAQDPDAREAMLRYFKTTRFMPVDPASQRALHELRRGVVQVRSEVE